MSMLDKFLRFHDDSCEKVLHRKSYCDCGRDAAEVELAKLKADLASARKILTRLAYHGVPIAMEWIKKHPEEET